MSLIFLRIILAGSFLLQFQLQHLPSYAQIEPTVDKDEDDGFTFLVSGGHRDPEKQKFARFMVSLRSQKPTKFFGDNHFCAGAIIAPDVVLTAAHCVMDKRRVVIRARRLLIVAGTPVRLTKAATTESYNVAKIKAHPAFGKNGFSDLAVIRIKGTFPQDNENIEILPMPTASPPIGQKCTTLGWGRMYWNGPLADATLDISATPYALDECRAKVSGSYDLANGMFCAGNSDDYTEDPCRGDTGGPLICNGNLTGIIARNFRCGQSHLPGLYTDVFHHLAWIQNALNAAHIKRVAFPVYAIATVFCF